MIKMEYNPLSSQFRGRSSMVERQLPKLHTGVRFPSPAPLFILRILKRLSVFCIQNT